ncbi:hypothetical protein RJ639_046703, partial [Escallonia herrerae]
MEKAGDAVGNYSSRGHVRVHEMAMKAAQAALSGGISVVLQQLVQDYPEKTIGAGTVLNVKDAKLAVNAGAKFLLSPATVKDILDDVQGSEVLCIPGAMTPTEILSAYNAGAKIVKVYPISALGGSRYFATLKKPFPHIPLVASQGITLDLIGEYIAVGASSVVLSDAIFDKEAMAQQNFGTIYRSSQLAVLLANEAVK